MLARMRWREKKMKRKNIFDSLMVPGNNVAFPCDLSSTSGFVTGLQANLQEYNRCILK
jgi:hypothetical protein